MALQTFKVRREQDPVLAAAVNSEITPVNWHKFPPVGVPAGGFPPINVPTVTYQGGATGDQTTTATINTTAPFAPLTHAAKAAAAEPDQTFATDITSPKGWIEPGEAYGAPPVSPTDDPTITSLSPNTGVSGVTPIWVKITGTKFTQWSVVRTAQTFTPYYKFISATRIDLLMDPRSSAGTVVVTVIDHGVASNGSTFTFT